MIQEILTYIIVGGALLYVGYKIVQLFIGKKNSCGCGDCGCDAKEVLKKK